MNKILKFAPLMLLLVFISCKPKGDASLSDKIEKLENTVDESSGQKEISSLLDAYSEFVNSSQESTAAKRKMLKKAYELAKNTGNDQRVIEFATRSLVDFPNDKGREAKVLDLISVHEKERKSDVAKVLKLAFIEVFPDFPAADSLKRLFQSNELSVDSLMVDLGKRVKSKPGALGINSLMATIYVDACKAYATVLSEKEQSPALLFSAAQLTTTMRQYDKAIGLYDWIVNKYPDSENGPIALATKGFILDNDLKDLDKAKEVYRQFIEDYPDHALTSQIQFLLENLGKSNEEILDKLNSPSKKQP
jgi:tetratricopeptide (TPR) repeat protein